MRRTAVFIAGLAALSGCTPILYLPEPAPTPMFEGAGDVQISDGFVNAGVEARVAASPVRHVGVFASAGATEEPRVRSWGYDVGGIAYTPLGGGYRVEGHAGWGRNHVEANGDDVACSGLLCGATPYAVEARVERAFGGVSVGRAVCEGEGCGVFGLGLRYEDVWALDAVRDDSAGVVGLPQPDARGGFVQLFAFFRTRGPVAFEAQYGQSLPLGPDSFAPYAARPSFLSVGLHLQLNRLRRRQGR